MLRSGFKRRLIASVATGALLVSPLMLSGFGPIAVSARAARTSVHKYTLGPGVKLSTYRFSTGPEQVRVITITQGGGVFDVAPAGATLGSYARPSAIASLAYDNGTQQGPALAGTNGDFAKFGKPIHVEQIDGEIWSSGLQTSPRFAINGSGSKAWIGNSQLTMWGMFNGSKLHVAHWNDGTPGANQISAYSQVGGSAAPPPGAVSPKSGDPVFCEVRLIPTSDEQWSDAGKSAITRSYVVASAANANPCQKTKMGLGSDPGAIVLASRGGGVGGALLPTMHKDDPITLTWQSNGWHGVVDSVGGTPVLVNNGVNVGPVYKPGQNYVYNYNPRTAIGINAGCADTDQATLCKVFLVTVDGRRSSWSTGWRMNQLGKFFVERLHARYALNLDGGGGTVMWANKKAKRFAACVKSAAAGCLVDKPSDGGGERGAIMALVALPGADLGLPRSLR